MDLDHEAWMTEGIGDNSELQTGILYGLFMDFSMKN